MIKISKIKEGNNLLINVHNFNDNIEWDLTYKKISDMLYKIKNIEKVKLNE